MVEDKIGGLIFSIGNPYSHIKWMNMFQSKAKTPLLIAMDAEWGPAMRLDDVFAYPWNMTLGAIQDNKIVKDISKRIAEQNKLLGIHYNFSPVVDVNSNPDNPIIGNRSFGEDPENVYQKSKAYIMGHQEVGVMTSIKHFPGHGDTSQDSHKTLPEIRSNLKRLNEVELYPYKKLIDDNIVNSVMAAHILYPSLDKKNPSSISKKIINHEERNQIRTMLKEIEIPKTMGLIVRTAGSRKAKKKPRGSDLNQPIKPLSKIGKEIANIKDAIRPAVVPASTLTNAKITIVVNEPTTSGSNTVNS